MPVSVPVPLNLQSQQLVQLSAVKFKVDMALVH
jgi:hypothetical protein